MMFKYGLIGEKLIYSSSKEIFHRQFQSKKLSYENYEINNIKEFLKLIRTNNFSGLNVTNPYKIKIIDYLDKIDPKAQIIGSVNTINFKKNKTIGFNTDYLGFYSAFSKYFKKNISVLILGSGGVSRSISYVLNSLKINYQTVSRTKNKHNITYEEIDKSTIKNNLIIINTTPLGTIGKFNEKPKIPYDDLSNNHILIDVNYYPRVTSFLREGINKNCLTLNGYDMLKNQALESWKIWNII